MGKHRLEQPSVGRKTAKSAVLAGSIAIGGSLAFAAAPAHATPVTVPNVGTFDVPGLPQNLVPKAPQAPSLDIGSPQQVRAKKALRYAESKIGSPYVYGAAGPNAFDCSGLTSWAYKQAGKIIPRDSYGQLGGGTPVASLAQARPGDILIFNGGGHAGIYAGDGIFVHSSTEGVPVKRDKVKAWDLTGIRRY
ncbi:C40 family peptidase [Gordonia neofelifaecis]|uniref:NLP/P60 protein n=1 Tax=Gordonia neofelifaecis NRRL B-59395 TaxID=644548 RepID=F1YHI9_9ACTN|nr:C40 family peptidase [Gordonia neofelifaecis]EGD55827.1 NLP/P60 protein [Gordonia neofelifaecis NRRL B-59395]